MTKESPQYILLKNGLIDSIKYTNPGGKRSEESFDLFTFSFSAGGDGEQQRVL